MNNLLMGASLEGYSRILLTALHAGAYVTLTVAALVGFLSLRAVPEIRCVEYQQKTIRWVQAGFLLLSLALISHAAWTTFSLGDYWTWDPAKNLGLLAWLVYAGVLHMHHISSLKGRKVILASLVGWGLLVAMNAAFAVFNI